MKLNTFIFLCTLFLCYSTSMAQQDQHSGNNQNSERVGNHTWVINTESPEALERRLEAYWLYLEKLDESIIATVSNQPQLVQERASKSSLDNRKLEYARVAFEHITNSGLKLKDGLKVLVTEEDSRVIVYVEADVPEDSLGPDFSVEVALNPNTKELIYIVSG